MNHEIKHIIKQSTTTVERKITILYTDKVNPRIYGIHTSLFFSQKLSPVTPVWCLHFQKTSLQAPSIPLKLSPPSSGFSVQLSNALPKYLSPPLTDSERPLHLFLAASPNTTCRRRSSITETYLFCISSHRCRLLIAHQKALSDSMAAN